MPLDKRDYEYTHLFRFLRDEYVYNLSLIQLSSILLFLEKANEFSQFSIRYCNTCGKDEFLEIDALNDIIKFLKENKASNRSVYKLDFAGDSFRIVEEERERNENKDFNYLCECYDYVNKKYLLTKTNNIDKLTIDNVNIEPAFYDFIDYFNKHHKESTIFDIFLE